MGEKGWVPGDPERECLAEECSLHCPRKPVRGTSYFLSKGFRAWQPAANRVGPCGVGRGAPMERAASDQHLLSAD